MDGPRSHSSDIDGLLRPRSVAVIGASEDLAKFGGRLLKNLVHHGFGGEIYPINPKRDTLLGHRCYPDISAAPTPPDMAVLALPRDRVKQVVQDCADAGVRLAIVITAQFSDAGHEGALLEGEIVKIAKAAGMRLIGPNCLGLISPAGRLVVTSSPALFVEQLPVGRIGLVSQSGALMATLFDRAQGRGIGFSRCFSIGNQADLELADFLDFLAGDAETAVICAYIEGIKSAQRFLTAARRARAAGKPVLAVKAGRTASGAAAAFSHTGSLAGSYAAFAAACQDAGVLVMDDPDAMIMLAALLERHGLPDRSEVAVLSPSGGSGAVMADRVTDCGLRLAQLSDETTAALAPAFGDRPCFNPIDMGAAKDGGTMSIATLSTEALLEEPAVGLVLVPVTTAPNVSGICADVCNGVEAARRKDTIKPCLFLLQPGPAAEDARALLRSREACWVDTYDEAVRVAEGLDALLHLRPRAEPVLPDGLEPPDVAGLSGALPEHQAKALLAAFGVPVNRGELAHDAASAAAAATQLTAPFAVKVVSSDIVHKSDLGGVVLGLTESAAVARAVEEMSARVAAAAPEAQIEGYLVQEMRRGELEMLVGARNDPLFGPVLTVGAGGVLVELLRDVAVARAPVDAEQAHAMIRSLKVAPLFDGYRGGPTLDLESLADCLVRVSRLICLLGPRFRELDVNPVLVGRAGEGCVGVDARILLA